MSSLPTPKARRLVKPSWKDARLIIGVLLVLLAVVIGAAAFSAADDRVGMWAAKHTLTPGHEVRDSDFVRVDVQLGEASSDYLGSGERLPNGAIIDRELRAGELVPRSAVIDPTTKRVREVPVRVDPIYLSNLTVGSRVTVFVPEARTKDPEGGATTDERVQYEELVQRATVSSLPESSGAVMGPNSGSSAVLVVPASQVEDIISIDQEETPVKLVLESGALKKGD
ncbi:hypothetical protein [Janibacter sp. GS2]|uniref:hypothetical protein n=1 Tax=Janibacter sp. GS2 TaxID=3442646 RepID=UPI003EBA91BD